jgi:Ca2+-binding RTX toxin-like protein
MANIRGTAGNDSLTGTSVDDLIEGLAGNDTLMGLAGNDTLDAGTGGDLLIGGSGNDTYIVDGPGDSIRENAGEGTDTVRSSATRSLEDNVENLVLTGTAAINGTGNALNNVITGNSASNFLVGGSGNDTLDGGAGDDTLDGTAGADLFIGGTGNDRFHVDGPGDTVRENAGEGIDTIVTSASRTLDANVENLALAAVGTTPINGTGNELNNAITGTAGSNVLSGLAGNDTLDGFLGDDTLDAGTGGDLLIGGDGNDTFILDGPGDTVRENPGEGTDTIRSSASRTLDANVENLVLIGAAAINGTGNALNNRITGNSAANSLSGLDGNDGLDGGDGDDTLLGGAGNDGLYPGSGNNVLDGGTGDDFYNLVGGGTNTINDAGGVDSIFTDQRQLTLPSGIENAEIREPLQAGTGNAVLTGNGLANDLTYTGLDDARIDGLGGNDTILGDEGDDTLNGGDGNDFIIGDFGDDTLRGGAGVDTLSGHEGDDSYFVTAGDFATEGASDDGSDIDTVFSPVSWTLGPDLDNLTFSNDGAAGNIAGVEGIGNERNNALDGRIVDRVRLEGRAGNDSLLGGAAADTLLGGTGNDVLSGGGGADSFTFAEAPGSANADRITDFTSGADKLALDDAFHAGIGAPGNFSAGDERFFAGAGAAGGQDASDRVIYDTTAGALYFDADGNGAGAAQLIATLQASPAIAATDIAVI